jgi:hypothetical protein
MSQDPKEEMGWKIMRDEPLSEGSSSRRRFGDGVFCRGRDDVRR